MPLWTKSLGWGAPLPKRLPRMPPPCEELSALACLSLPPGRKNAPKLEARAHPVVLLLTPLLLGLSPVAPLRLDGATLALSLLELPVELKEQHVLAFDARIIAASFPPD